MPEPQEPLAHRIQPVTVHERPDQADPGIGVTEVEGDLAFVGEHVDEDASPIIPAPLAILREPGPQLGVDVAPQGVPSARLERHGPVAGPDFRGPGATGHLRLGRQRPQEQAFEFGTHRRHAVPSDQVVQPPDFLLGEAVETQGDPALPVVGIVQDLAVGGVVEVRVEVDILQAPRRIHQGKDSASTRLRFSGWSVSPAISTSAHQELTYWR